jgi:hypothetical protein
LRPKQIGIVVVVNRIPPRRRRRGGVIVVVAAVLLATFLPSILALLDGTAAPGTIETVIYGSALGLALSVIAQWIFYRPGRQLYRVMTKANQKLQVVPIYSSDNLIDALKELNGSQLVSSALPTGAYMLFVDAGRQFEIWRWNRSRPERVIRLSWSAVRSIDIGTISHLVIVDRALIMSVKSDDTTVQIPISPQECRAVRLTPVKDAVFNTMLSGLQSRVAINRLDADPRLPNPTVQLSSEPS